MKLLPILSLHLRPDLLKFFALVFLTALPLFAATEEAAAPAASSAADAEKILKTSDRARGGGLPGVVWSVRLTSTDEQGDPERRLLVKAVQNDSLAETVFPPRASGTKLLQVGRNMWLSRTGLKKPVPISPRQKMSGLAAQGDIASTNYAVDYTPTLLGEDKVNGETCYKLDLRANNKFATYDRIIYWISKEGALGVKAEFYSVSGKLLKSAEFEYKNNVSYNGETFPFISKMVISDALKKQSKTVLEYSEIKTSTLPRDQFSVTRMAG